MAHRRVPDRARLFALVMLAACGGKGASAPTSSSSPSPAAGNDALFALAPAGTRSAVVFSGRALELFEATRARAQAIGRQDPVLAGPIAKAEAGLTDALGVAPGATLAQLGLGHDRGLAVFKLSGYRTVSIWPVADRKAFVAGFHGQAGADGVDSIAIAGHTLRCRQVKDVYACAAEAAVLDQLGTGSLAGKAAAAGARGDVEVVAATNDDRTPGAALDLAITVALEPGQATIRARIGGAIDDDLRRLAGAPVHLDPGHAAGFLAVAIPASLAQADVDGPLGDALHAIRGPVTAVVPSGVADIDVRIPLSSSAPVRQLLAHCDRFPLSPDLTLTVDGDRCLLTSTRPPQFSAVAWLDGDTLRFDRTGGAPAPATGPELTPGGRELAASSWTMVAWGRGLVGTSARGFGLGALAGDDQAGLGLRAIGYLRELGIGVRYGDDAFALTLVVRTALANPPAVTDALPGLIARAAGGADISADLASLARAHPGSPLADDLAAGPAGLAVPSMALGMLAAVAIPKFLDYLTVSKKSEAELDLNAIQHAAAAEVVENVQFPIATAPLTPARPCCEGPGHRCPAVESDWVGVPAWDALGFERTQPGYFQYSYRSDGKTMTATAVGDLDCDGNTVTYELDGTIVDGTPRFELHRPARAD